MDALMPFQEQLEEYPALKAMFASLPPKNRVPAVSPPWRVWAKRTEDSPWGRKDFPTYRGAFDFWKTKRHVWVDISITSKRQAFEPPGRVVRIVRRGEPVMVKLPGGKTRQQTKLVPIKPPPGHLWCMYCRRFTIFTWFLKHHTFGGDLKGLMDTSTRRCCICGISEATGAYTK